MEVSVMEEYSVWGCRVCGSQMGPYLCISHDLTIQQAEIEFQDLEAIRPPMYAYLNTRKRLISCWVNTHLEHV